MTSTNLPDDSPLYGCELPSLDELVPLGHAQAAFLNAFFGFGIRDDQPYHVLGLKVIALAETALREYKAARALLAPVGPDTVMKVHNARSPAEVTALLSDLRDAPSDEQNELAKHLQGVTHLETCIGALFRALEATKQLRRAGKLPESLARRPLSRKHDSDIRFLRHAIEHADRNIMKDIERDIDRPGDPLLLAANRQDVQLRDRRMSYEDLSASVRELVEFASALGHHRDG